jgi:hypothetical protein
LVEVSLEELEKQEENPQSQIKPDSKGKRFS